MLRLVLIALAAVGFLISSYFTAVAYRWIRPDAPWIPAFCRLGEQTCAAVVDTPRARLLGLPNSVPGQLFYLAIGAAGAAGVLFEPPAYPLLLIASAAAVAMGAFLTYSLLFLTRVPCTLCFTSHAINLVIFLLLLLGSGAVG